MGRRLRAAASGRSEWRAKALDDGCGLRLWGSRSDSCQNVRERWGGGGGMQKVDLRVREEGVTGEPGDWLLVSPSV